MVPSNLMSFAGKVLFILVLMISAKIYMDHSGSWNIPSLVNLDPKQTAQQTDVAVQESIADSSIQPPLETESATIPGRPNQKEFQRIYTHHVWEGARSKGRKGGGGSGDGSNPANVKNLTNIVEDVINQYNVQKWMDAPCGSVRWTSIFLRDQQTKRAAAGKPELQYLGLDVVESVIRMNQEEFQSEANWTFQMQDLETEPVPKGYDLILCRDALQHLPLKTTLRVLKNFANSGAKWLLTSSYPKPNQGNKNIIIGDYYPIDLKKEPFGLVQTSNEYDEQFVDKILYLYDIEKYLKTIDFDKILSETDWNDPKWGKTKTD